MVEDLLTAARLDADNVTFTIEPTSVNAEIDAVVAPMQRSGHDITVVGHESVALCDKARLRQITRNLVSNAMKHGGPRIEVSIANEADHVAIRVSDNGAGVSEDMEGRLFERFAHEGTESLLVGSVGLGLAIAKTLAERMDGDLTHDADAVWTTFVCTLPLAPVDAEAPEPHLEEGPIGFAAEHDPDDEFAAIFGEAPEDESAAEPAYSERITFDRG